MITLSKVVMLVVGMVTPKVVPIMIAEHVSMMKKKMIWRTCFGPLDQRFY